MRFPPPDVVALWPKPNYVNPETRGPALVITEFTFLSLTLIIVGLRLYVRGYMLKRIWWDDWLMVCATVCVIGVTTCVVLATQRYGWNVHIWDLPVALLTPSRKVSIAGQSIFVFASGFTKLSLLVSYLRIAVSKSFVRAIYVSIAITAAWMVIFTIVLWTQCIPISEYWTLSLTTNRNCVSEGPPILGQTITTILTDVLVYLLPMPILWKLQLPNKQRLSLLALFSLGAFACLASIMRTYYSHYVIYQTYDVSWAGYNLWIWTALEVNLGVISGSIPALKPLFFKVVSRTGTPDGGLISVSRHAASKLREASHVFSKRQAPTDGHTGDEEVPITLREWSDGSDLKSQPLDSSTSSLASETKLVTALPTIATRMSMPSGNTWTAPAEWRDANTNRAPDRRHSRPLWIPKVSLDRWPTALLENQTPKV